MYSGKDLAELPGYTSRVYSLLASLHALDKDVYPENPRPASLPDGTVSCFIPMSVQVAAKTSGFLRSGGCPWRRDCWS